MLMTFLSRVTNSDEKVELRAMFCSVGRVPLSASRCGRGLVLK
jgi:hypothetical protein